MHIRVSVTWSSIKEEFYLQTSRCLKMEAFLHFPVHPTLQQSKSQYLVQNTAPKMWLTSWETCIQVRKQQLELDMEQQTGSK